MGGVIANKKLTWGCFVCVCVGRALEDKRTREIGKENLKLFLWIMIESFHMHQEKEVKDEPFLYCCWSRDHASLDPPLLWRRPFQNCCAFTKGKLQHPTGKGSTGLDSAVETQGLGTFPWGWRQKAGEAAELIWPPNIRPPFFHSSHIFVSACGHPERRLLLSGSSGVDSDHVTPSRLVG